MVGGRPHFSGSNVKKSLLRAGVPVQYLHERSCEEALGVCEAGCLVDPCWLASASWGGGACVMLLAFVSKIGG